MFWRACQVKLILICNFSHRVCVQPNLHSSQQKNLSKCKRFSAEVLSVAQRLKHSAIFFLNRDFSENWSWSLKLPRFDASSVQLPVEVFYSLVLTGFWRHHFIYQILKERNKGEIKHEVLENPSAIWGNTFNDWHFYYRNQFQNCGYDPPKQYGFVTKFKKFPYVERSACTSNSKFLHISHQ